MVTFLLKDFSGLSWSNNSNTTLCLDILHVNSKGFGMLTMKNSVEGLGHDLHTLSLALPSFPWILLPYNIIIFLPNYNSLHILGIGTSQCLLSIFSIPICLCFPRYQLSFSFKLHSNVNPATILCLMWGSSVVFLNHFILCVFKCTLLELSKFHTTLEMLGY